MEELEGKDIGFIGLGAMGTPMVKNLAAKLPPQTTIYVHDIATQAIDDLCSQHPNRIIKASNARDIAEKSQIILTMLPEGPHLLSVFTAPQTSVLSLPPLSLSHKLFIDHSTLDPATSLHISSLLTSHSAGASFHDAPVSGGVLGACAGTLAFFLGASPTSPSLPLLTSLLSLMGKPPIPCGGPSLGLVAKLSNNYLSGLIAIAASEAFDMGMRAGLDPRVLARVYSAGTAQNAICERFCPVPGVVEGAPSSEGYKGGFRVELMRKDFGLAREMAERVGSGNFLGEVGGRVYEGVCGDERCRGLDSRVVFRWIGGEENWKGRGGEEGEKGRKEEEEGKET